MTISDFNHCIKKLDDINILNNLNPERAIKLSNELIDFGYRAPAVFEALARAYIKLGDYQSAISTLLQAKADYGYDPIWTLRGIMDRFRSDLNTDKKLSAKTRSLNKIIDELVLKRKKSSWAGEDMSLSLSLAKRKKLYDKVSKIWHLRKSRPEKSLEEALKLFNEGYRTELVCRCIASCYKEQNDIKKEIDFLIQVKRDYMYYNFDGMLRSALKLLEKHKSIDK